MKLLSCIVLEWHKYQMDIKKTGQMKCALLSLLVNKHKLCLHSVCVFEEYIFFFIKHLQSNVILVN